VHQEKAVKKERVWVFVVGFIQLVLGVIYLLAPHGMLRWMGHSAFADDMAYPLGMLAARFLVYGVMLMLASRDPGTNRLLIMGMVWIQLIDLGAGIFYTLQGTVGLALSAFPMFNAGIIALLLWLWLPAPKQVAP
jgi:hypothetical protein